MTIKQFIQNKDVKLNLFSWNWATTDPEKFRVYNALLDDFLAKPEVAKQKFRPKVLWFWHLYCGVLQDYALNGSNDKAEQEKLVKQCPLSGRELKTLFGTS